MRARARYGPPLRFAPGALAALTLAGALGCAPFAAANAPGPEPSAATALLGSYSGVVPCADCPGIRYSLTLLPDSIAVRRMTYLEADDGKDVTFSELRGWRLAADGPRVVLYGATGAPQLLAVAPGGRKLSMLDAGGNPIRSGLNFDLARADTSAGAPAPLTLRGHYRYMADAGTFQECETERSFPVSREADNAALERAYLGAVHRAGQPLLVSLVAWVAMRPSMEGEGRRALSIVPVRFVRVEENGRCGEPADRPGR
ncbi:MAG TPA: copper resistance protein NlpE N-terminal domain-containing protein [Longimicrobiaceae bacterium]|nr:copper resistance protein NlpE N-terminal domain-containing protein [Longimicrobiaceae bacterium]